jgi:hypothetical protein
MALERYVDAMTMEIQFEGTAMQKCFRSGSRSGFFCPQRQAVACTLWLMMLLAAGSGRAADPLIYTQPQSENAAAGMNVTFTVTASGTTPLHLQWTFNGTDLPGATNTALTLIKVGPANAGTYSATVTNIHGQTNSSNVVLVLGPVALWGAGSCSACMVPLDLTNALAISGYYQHFMAIKTNGTVRGWGGNGSGQTNVPAGLTNVVAISGGDAHSLALKDDGTVVGWGAGAVNTGFPQVGQLLFPPGLSNVVALAGGAWHCLALKSNGTVLAWGSDGYGQTDVPAGTTNIVAVAGGWGHTLALRSDGQVIGWGAGVTNGPFPHLGQCAVPAGLSNVVAISANGYHSLALKQDGTVVAWGAGQTNSGAFPDFGQAIVPAGLSGVVAISAGFFHSMALKRNGQVVTWGSIIPIDAGLTNVTAIEGGYSSGMALVSGSAPYITGQPLGQTVGSGSQVLFRVSATGAFPLAYRWQWNGTNIAGATNQFLALTNVAITAAGDYRCLVTNSVGTVNSAPATLAVTRQPLQFLTSPAYLQRNNAGLQMRLTGLAGGGRVIVYASTNLLDWGSIFTNPPSVGALDFLDSDATNQPLRFYKAVEGP